MKPLDPPSDAELAADISALVRACGGVVPAASVSGVSHQRVSQWQSPNDPATPNYKQICQMQHFADSRVLTDAMAERLSPKSGSDRLKEALELVTNAVQGAVK